MKNIFIIALLAGWIFLGCYFYHQNVCGAQAATNEVPAATTVAPVEEEKGTGDKGANLGVWSISDGEGFSVESSAHISFPVSEQKHISPLDKRIGNSLSAVAAYLKDHPDKKLDITGYYGQDEENNSILSNLGLARAYDVRKVLTDMGVNKNQIGVGSELAPSDWFDKGALLKGADFAFSTVDLNSTAAKPRVEEIRSRLVGKAIILHFETDSDNIMLSEKQRRDLSDIIYYLDEVDEAKLKVNGYTDNVGNRDYNVNLSKERAKFVVRYLSEKGGISPSRTEDKGFGPDKPIAPNTTAEGRAENRRVEVILK